MTKNDLAKDIGENIRYKMEQLGMTQTDLAKASNIYKSTLSHYVNGDRIPTIKHIVNISYALNCDIGDLVMIFDID